MTRSILFSWLAAAIAVGLMLTGGVLVQREFDRSIALRDEVDRSYRIRMHLREVLSLHQDLETGQRGYVITGDRSFLAPYLRARALLPQEERRLTAATAGNRELERGLVGLWRLSAAKLDFATAAVDARGAGNDAQSSALVAGGGGKRIMDRIRLSIDRLDRSEATRLRQGILADEQARRRTRRLTLLFQAIAGLLIATAGFVIFRTMAARRRALDRANDLSTRFRAMLESAKDGIITLDAGGRIEGANTAAARMFGYQTGELDGHDVATLFETMPSGPRVGQFLQRLRTKSGEVGRIDEFDAKRKDGSVVPCEVAVSPMELTEGVHFVAVIRDITERKQMDLMKNEFISTVSHELRTPLTSIAGSLSLIAGGATGALSERTERLVDIALSNSQRLVRLINDLLDVEKIESGAVPFEIVEVPLRAFLGQALAANQAFADLYKVEFELAPVPEDAVVRADPDRLMQVLTNLLSNAAKFSPDGGCVRVSARLLGTRWRISVLDQGGGIPEGFRSRIFGKFAQADSSGTRVKGGTGLGLSIVRSIVGRLGGSVSFETAEGLGTVFHVALPAALRESPARGVNRDLPRILHVDDDEDVLKVVASAFEGRALVEPASSLASAREKLASGSYALMILDIGLADGSGLDLLAESSVAALIFTAQDFHEAANNLTNQVLIKSRATLDELIEAAEQVIASEEVEAS